MRAPFVVALFPLLFAIGCGKNPLFTKASPAKFEPIKIVRESATITSGSSTALKFGTEVNPSETPEEPSVVPTPSPESTAPGTMVHAAYWWIPHGTTLVNFFYCPGFGGTVFNTRADVYIDSTRPTYSLTYQVARIQANYAKSAYYGWCYPVFSQQYVFF